MSILLLVSYRKYSRDTYISFADLHKIVNKISLLLLFIAVSGCISGSENKFSFQTQYPPATDSACKTQCGTECYQKMGMVYSSHNFTENAYLKHLEANFTESVLVSDLEDVCFEDCQLRFPTIVYGKLQEANLVSFSRNRTLVINCDCVFRSAKPVCECTCKGK